MSDIEEIAIELAKRRRALKDAKRVWSEFVAAAFESHQKINLADGESENKFAIQDDPCWRAMIFVRPEDVDPLPKSEWCAACLDASRARDSKNRAARMVAGALRSLDAAYRKTLERRAPDPEPVSI